MRSELFFFAVCNWFTVVIHPRILTIRRSFRSCCSYKILSSVSSYISFTLSRSERAYRGIKVRDTLCTLSNGIHPANYPPLPLTPVLMFINYKLTGMLSYLKFTRGYFIRRGMNKRICQVYPSKRHPKGARQSLSLPPRFLRSFSSLFFFLFFSFSFFFSAGISGRVAVRTARISNIIVQISTRGIRRELCGPLCARES